MVECGICLEEYLERDLELHREMCMVRLIFRCTECNEDYSSKEGLWNHLDLHEIAGESKELHYQELKAKHKLHQCVLCSDHRAYSEDSYWTHIHNVHNGVFLRCPDCGDNFRSEELRNDHRCEIREQPVSSGIDVPLKVENMEFDVEHTKLTHKELNSKANEGLQDVVLNTDNSAQSKINSTKGENLPLRFSCEKCGMTFSSKGFLLRHEKTKYSCLEVAQQKCPHCRRVFRANEYQAHFSLCEKKSFSCELCPLKFQSAGLLTRHGKNAHRDREVSKNATKSRRATNRTDHVISTTDSSSSSNDKDNCKTQQDVASRSSDTKCSQCGKECGRTSYLRKHIVQAHQLMDCSFCGITFEGFTKAQYHKIKYHTKPNFECAKCSKKFHYIRLYERHIKVCDPLLSDFLSEPALENRNDPKAPAGNPPSDASYIKCSYCEVEESSTDALARHILTQHDPVACDICGTTLSSLSEAQHHRKMMHKESKLKCPHCSMQFFSGMRLQNHAAKCENEKVPCEFCGKGFKNETAVSNHIKFLCPANKHSKKQRKNATETGLWDEIYSPTAMQGALAPLAESGLSQTKCYYCFEELSSAGYLHHHLKTCHELTKCDTCGMTVIGISYTKNHKIKYHKDAEYSCSICGKSFHNQRALTNHQFFCERKVFRERSHPVDGNLEDLESNKEQMPISDVQGKATDTPSIKIEHEQVDTTDTLSNKGTITHSEMGAPMVSIPSSNDSPGSHVIPDKTSQPSVESPSNQPNSCSICNVSFNSSYQMNYHRKTRHTEGKFRCPHCSRSFHFSRKWQMHVSACATLKHSCDLCNQKFQLVSQLEKHKKRDHHSEGPSGSTNIGGVDAEVDTAHGMNTCIICRATFPGTDELKQHKLTCLKCTKKNDSGDRISPSMEVSQGANLELKLEIKVEEPMLQE